MEDEIAIRPVFVPFILGREQDLMHVADERAGPRLATLGSSGAQSDQPGLEVHLGPFDLFQLAPPDPGLVADGGDRDQMARKFRDQPIELWIVDEPLTGGGVLVRRSEERRGGEKCRSRWAPAIS